MFVALLRGVNVGGHNKLPMKALREHLATAGATSVQTYIQSGNIVFGGKGSAATWTKKLASLIEMHFGFRPDVLVLDEKTYRVVVEAYPFDADEGPHTNHHVYFRVGSTTAKTADIDALKTAGERFACDARAAYLRVENGLSKSKLAAKLPRLLGGSVTQRNMKTARKLIALLNNAT